MEENELRNFKLRVLDFYIELAILVKSRFSLNDLVLKFFSNFSTSVAISGKVVSISVEAQVYFPHLIKDVVGLDSE